MIIMIIILIYIKKKYSIMNMLCICERDMRVAKIFNLILKQNKSNKYNYN